MDDLDALLGSRPVERIRLSHPGRVRVSELRQELRSGRIRDPMQVLFDGRYADQALRISIIDASPARSLAVVFLDLNGMKEANDTLGHAAGDVLVRAYLNAVAAAVEDKGDAFRVGGDEVLALLPAHDAAAAEQMVRRVHHLLAGEQLKHEGRPLPHRSLCAGVAVVSDPTEVSQQVRDRADAAMYRAKAASKRVRKGTQRPSLLAVDGQEDLIPLGTARLGSRGRAVAKRGRRRRG